MIADFRGKRVTVMGLGSFGGGTGAVRYLVAQGATVTVTDLKSAAELAPSLAAIGESPNLILHLGGHDARDFRKADLVVASPAVPKESRYLEEARSAGVPISSEMNLFWERNPGRTICVTGSNGKSTTTALIHALLAGAGNTAHLRAPESETAAPAGPESGVPRSPDSMRQGTAGPRVPAPAARPSRVWLGGNIGKSLLPVVDQIQTDDWVVLELSSFQLDDLTPLEPNPHVAVVTNFTPNHLDRHASVDAYRAAKQNILRWQTADRLAVLNQSDPEVLGWRTSARRVFFGREDEGRQGVFAIGFDSYKRRVLYRFGPREQVLPLGQWLALPGVHNFQNAMAATCTALVLGEGPAEIEAGLTRFEGLPHRLQLVAEAGGKKFYNDSKATTPEATLLAIEAFRTPVVLLAGGYDKGLELTGFAQGIVARHVKAVALMGQTAGRLKDLIRAADSDGKVATKVHVTLESAFAWANAQASAGEIVLLSPGCASYDWFPNFEARGEEFTRLARATAQ
jgi:UDP-N-acetylmuramoylalanine--D-glutamate ligase